MKGDGKPKAGKAIPKLTIDESGHEGGPPQATSNGEKARRA
jgi:hypothetical protein